MEPTPCGQILRFTRPRTRGARSGMRRTTRFSGCFDLGCRAGCSGAIRPGRHPFWISFWTSCGVLGVACPELPESAGTRVWRIATLTLVRGRSFGRGTDGFLTSAKTSRYPRCRSLSGLICYKMSIAFRPFLPVRRARVHAEEMPQSVARHCGWRERIVSTAHAPTCVFQTGME